MTKRSRALPKRTATLVPIAVLSAAWTVNVAAVPVAKVARPPQVHPVTAPPARLPAGTVVPMQAYEAPVSVSSPETAAPRIPGERPISAVATEATSSIPTTALAAYQRAATVIDAADPGCGLDWQLIAAIGRVESDHGQYGGNTLAPNGVATPGIFGPVLDGHGVALIRDTDGGLYDGDTRFDRAVGPMQFIPSTWAVVGVDADSDGQRNPQDINDAALATAVYLCAGTDDLSTPAGQRTAVFRYNHSSSYVSTVLGIAAAYLAGDFTSTATATPAIDVRPGSAPTPQPASDPTSRHHNLGASGDDSGQAAPPAIGMSVTGSRHHQQAEDLTPAATPPALTAASSPPATSGPGTPPVEAASADELSSLCNDEIATAYPNAPADAVEQAVDLCVAQLTGSTLADARVAVADVVAALATQVEGPGPTPTPTAQPSAQPSSEPSPTGDANTPSPSSPSATASP